MSEKDKIQSLMGHDLWDLYQVLSDHAQRLLKQESVERAFTTHDLTHSYRIARNIELLIQHRVELKPFEAFVLLGASVLHDVALACPHKTLPRDQREHGWYDADLRRNHGMYSAQYVRSELFTSLTNSPHVNKIHSNADLIEGIALLCHFHTSELDIVNLCRPPSKRLNRIQMLAYLFILADELDVGYDRVKVSNVLRSSIPSKSKEFWLLRASITEVRIRKKTILLIVSRPRELPPSRFKKVTLEPLVRHLKSLLTRANAVFAQYQIQGLSIRLKLSDVPVKVSDEVTRIDGMLSMRLNMEQQKRHWQDYIDAKIYDEGVLKKNQIGNEFHVYRRWGSSTHRNFPSWSGLEKGGGYYLSWSGCGLCIDPGYDFIANTFSLNFLSFTARDFHAILASHAHDDHTQDIETLITLQYRLRRDAREGFEADFDIFPVICSEGVRWKYAPILASNKFLQFETLVPTKHSRPTHDTVGNTERPISVLNSAGIKIESTNSFHGETPWHLNNTGVATKVYCRYKEKTFCVGYTSDTSYEPDLVKFFYDADLMLIHLGDRHDKNDPMNLKPDSHLGEGGCIDLISELKFHKPKLFLLGEFGADEFIVGGSDNRIQFTLNVEHQSGADQEGLRVLPADIGLRVSLPDLRIYCEPRGRVRPNQPTGDNPYGTWIDPCFVDLDVYNGHEIHYLVNQHVRGS